MIHLIDLYHWGSIPPEALRFLYTLMQEREPELNISHRALPTYEEHRQFVNRRVFRCWYLIEGELVTADEFRPPRLVGYVSATHMNEIGVVLLKSARGFGIGPMAIRELMRLHAPLPPEPGVRNGHWLANIAPENVHSQHVFQKLGFRLIQQTYELTEEEHHGKSTEATGST